MVPDHLFTDLLSHNDHMMIHIMSMMIIIMMMMMMMMIMMMMMMIMMMVMIITTEVGLGGDVITTRSKVSLPE